MIEHVEAFDDVRVVYIAKNLDFTADLTAYHFLVVSVYDLEGVDPTRRAVEHLVHRPTRTRAHPVLPLEFGEGEGGVGVGA